ncbi:EamA family transporter [[Bacillus] caldolyticus]|uniref:EamA family transporter n=1 Tax=Bacillus caldolyticus TaxID=1394 RepID=A0ABM6QKU6_BACCL|nr:MULTISPECIES: DMT family transporter [Geobacillus]AUI36102.1 EamA family transporter [[Bacillus] caldolyticus]QNU24372.1 DMT family transporter [Geobacillus zalihae]
MKEKIFLVLANLFWAGNYLIGKYVVAEIGPLWLTFIRWSVAFLFLLPISYFLERPRYGEIMKQFWLPLSIAGILGIIGYNLLLYGALEYTSPMNAAIVNALNPAVIVILSYFLLKERMTFVNVVGFILSLVGVLFILTNGHLQWIFQTSYNRGDLMMLIAGVVWALYSIIGKKLAVPPITATTCSVFFSVILLLPFLLLQPFPLAGLSGKEWIGISYICLFPSVFSFLFWNLSVKKVGPSYAGIYLNLIAVFTAIITFLLGGKISAPQLIGGAFVLIGVYLATNVRKTEASPAKDASM